MKKFLLFSVLFGLSTATSLFAADMSGQKQLQQAATGMEFNVGKTKFRMVPTAVVQETSPATDQSTEDQTRSLNSAPPLAQIGPYGISLSPRLAIQSRALGASPSGAAYAVAVDQRSGQPVLVAARLRAYNVTSDQAAALAQASNGKVVLFSKPASMAILGYNSPAEAATALGKLKQTAPTQSIELQIVQGFDQPN